MVIHDLIDGVLLIRADPEQQVHLQRLHKIRFQPCALIRFVLRVGRERIRFTPLGFILLSLISSLFCRILYLGISVSRIVLSTIAASWVCKVFDVNQIGFSQPAPFALNQSKLFQFPEEFRRLVIGTAQCIHDLLHRKNDIHPFLLIQPSVFHRQPHAVQQDAVQCFGIGGQVN